MPTANARPKKKVLFYFFSCSVLAFCVMTALPERDFVPGDVVSVNGAKGTVRFYGTTEFAPGKWVGIELPMPTGKNDGSVKDKRYFVCEPNHGSFVRPPQVTLVRAAHMTCEGEWECLLVFFVCVCVKHVRLCRSRLLTVTRAATPLLSR